MRWTEQADQLFVMHKPKGPIQQLEGPFCALLELKAPNKKRRDLDNLWKCPLDFMARLGLISDDKYMQWGLIGWVDDLPYGARLTLMSCDKKEGLPDMLAALIASLAGTSREKT